MSTLSIQVWQPGNPTGAWKKQNFTNDECKVENAKPMLMQKLLKLLKLEMSFPLPFPRVKPSFQHKVPKTFNSNKRC